MIKLTDYLKPELLEQLQASFTTAWGQPVAICGLDGNALLTHHDSPNCTTTPIMVGGILSGHIKASCNEHQTSPDGLLQLMADMVSRLYSDEQRLRSRAEELAALFSLTTEFTGTHDLQNVLNLVAQTVVRAMNAKACGIRLLNEDHTELVIKAVANLSKEYLNKGPIVVSKSVIDTEVISTGRPVYIANEQNDPRVLYPVEAKREGIVSALCAPLMYKGKAEGVIRVYTSEKHVFDWFETALLQTIAVQAAAAIVNARLYEDILETETIRRQLKIASEVQRRLTPAKPPNLDGFDIAAVYTPCYELGGDFYDFISLPPNNLGVVICDVAGKGIPASLLMASLRATLRAHALNIYDMSAVLDKVNKTFCADTLMSEFATMFYGVLDYRSRSFTFTNAGHCPPILFRDGQVRELATGGGLLGINPTLQYAHNHLTFRSGDVLLMFTDGLTEALNHKDEGFGRDRIIKAANVAIGENRPAAHIARHIIWEMRRFVGLQSKFDDLTVLVLKVL